MGRGAPDELLRHERLVRRAGWLGGIALLLAVTLGAAAPSIAAPLSWSSPMSIDTRPLTTVSCVSSALCVAADDIGSVVVSTDPQAGGGSWTTRSLNLLETEPILGLSCPLTTLCVAGGEYSILTSTDPTGPAAGWTQQTTEVQHPFEREGPHFGPRAAVSCASSSLCVAALDPGNDLEALASSRDPTGGSNSWTSTTPFLIGDQSHGPILGVSCVSQSLCMAVDGAGNVLASSNPGSSESAWTTTPVALVSLQGISCPTASLCVAVDDAGDVVVSTNPTGDGSAWTSSNVDGAVALTAVSCASSSLCTAVDADGKALVSTDPTGGAAAWSPMTLDAGHAFTAVSCTEAGMCVAVDDAGYETVGTMMSAGAVVPAAGDGGVGTATLGLTILASPASPTPSSALRIMRVKVERGGRIAIALQAPTAGTVTALATASIPRAIGSRRRQACRTGCMSKIAYGKASAIARAADLLNLTIKPSGDALAALRDSRELRVPIDVRFTPSDGPPVAAGKTVNVRYRRLGSGSGSCPSRKSACGGSG